MLRHVEEEGVGCFVWHSLSADEEECGEHECVRCELCLCVDINRQGPAVTLLLNGLTSHMPTTSGPTSLPLCVWGWVSLVEEKTGR